LITVKQPRARRFVFVADVDLTHLDTSEHIKGKTTDLSVFGCHVSTQYPFPEGTRVRVRIAHKGATFATLATVAHAKFGLGMGILFTRTDTDAQAILDSWLAGLRDK
jgi:hypothetical protein